MASVEWKRLFFLLRDLIGNSLFLWQQRQIFLSEAMKTWKIKDQWLFQNDASLEIQSWIWYYFGLGNNKNLERARIAHLFTCMRHKGKCVHIWSARLQSCKMAGLFQSCAAPPSMSPPLCHMKQRGTLAAPSSWLGMLGGLDGGGVGEEEDSGCGRLYSHLGPQGTAHQLGLT